MNKNKVMKVVFVLSLSLILLGCNLDNKSIEENKDFYKKNDVIMSLDIKNIEGEMKILGKTNLPDGMKLMIAISNDDGYSAENDSSEVKNGSFESVTFNKLGNVLDDGIYKIKIKTLIAGIQHSEVINIIGNGGGNLKGDLVVSDDFGDNIVEYHDEFVVEGSHLYSKKVLLDDEVYDYMKHEFDMITNYGNSYSPEIHDAVVIRSASKKFGISEYEADRIYLNAEVIKSR